MEDRWGGLAKRQTLITHNHMLIDLKTSLTYNDNAYNTLDFTA